LTSLSESVPQQPAVPSARPFLIGCGFFLLLMLYLGIFAPRSATNGFDFRSFYTSGVMVRTQPHALYDLTAQKQVQDALVSRENLPLPFAHPSYEALFYAPFSLASYRTDYLLFLITNVFLLALVFFLSRPLFDGVIPALQPRPGLMFFLFIPVIIAIWQGQDSILFLLLFCCAWRQVQRGRDFSAGVFLALCLFRFQLAIPLAIFFAVRRGRSFVAGFVVAGAAVAALCFAILGRDGVVSMFELMRSFSLSNDHGTLAQQAMAVHPLAMPNLYGLVHALGGSHLSSRVSFGMTIGLSIALFLWSLDRARRAGDDATAFGIAILCSVLVSQHLYMHDASLLLPAFALLHGRVHNAILVVCYVLPAVLFLLAGSPWFFLLAVPVLFMLYDACTARFRKLQLPAKTVRSGLAH
jgi:hypothetical protein